jgi:hypothetical protein
VSLCDHKVHKDHNKLCNPCSMAEVSYQHNPWRAILQESAFLLTSVAVLLAGMVFTSRGFRPGSMGHTLLTVVAALVIVAAVASFVVLLCFEVYRSIKVRHRACGRGSVAANLQDAHNIRL